MSGLHLGGRRGGHLPPLLNSCPPCNIKLAQQISFMVKYLSENVPEVISESVKLKLFWESIPSLFQQIPVLPPLGNFSKCSTACNNNTL